MFTAALASAGCVTDTGGGLNVRPLADPYTKAAKPGSPAIEQGRGFLALGSVGLAIEAFRKALVVQPDSIEALAGLAECYDQMGRHDLSRAKYEAALAIAPNNTTLLRTFAASLQRQGRSSEAAALSGEATATERAEAAAPVRSAPTAPLAIAPLRPASVRVAEVQPKSAPEPARINIAEPRLQLASASVVRRTEWKIEAPEVAPLETPSASVTVKLPPAMPASVEAPKAAVATVALPERINMPRVSAAPVSVETPKIAAATPQPAVAVHLGKATTPPIPRVDAIEVAAVSSVTVKLPPPRPVGSPPQEPVAPPTRKVFADATLVKTGPRLERLSLGEVALMTDPRPRWRTDAARWTAITTPFRPAPLKSARRELAVNTPVRFVPLAELQRGHGVRVLNAARHEGLAARTRLALNHQGWKGVTIGDAGRIREKSLVLYSARTEKAARRLAAQFGFWIAREARPGPLTILLGRDWATRHQARG